MATLLIDEIAQLAEDEGLGTVDDDIFIGNLPHDTDDCIMFRETSGFPPDMYVPLREPTFQCIVRNRSYNAGREIAENVLEAFTRLANLEITTGGTYAYYLHPQTDIAYLAMDMQKRHEWSMNFSLLVR